MRITGWNYNIKGIIGNSEFTEAVQEQFLFIINNKKMNLSEEIIYELRLIPDSIKINDEFCSKLCKKYLS